MKHKCGTCGTAYELEYEKGQKLPANFPFCSIRCKMIDLGKWFNEEYRISTTVPGAEQMSETEKEILAQFLLDTGEVDEVIDGNES